MRALQRCDFCGDEAVGTFEIVPPELEPTDAEQRRVLLCPNCETRLGTLLEPLFGRLGVEEADADGSELEATAGESEASGTVREYREPLGETDDSSEGGDANANERSAGNDGDGSETGGETNAELGEDGDPATGEDGDSAAAEDDESANDTDDSTGGEESDVAAADTEKRRPPSGYGRVIRLLRNREFPMERSAAESLVAGAYDLERDEVDAIIEYAVETGELDEDGDRLVRS